MPDSYDDTPQSPLAPAPLTKSQQATLRRALRLLESQLTASEVFDHPTTVKQYCRLQIGLERDEHFCCLFLNTRHALIASERLFQGTVDGASVYPRVVVRRYLELNASAVIFTHNHPSGIAEPSRDDATITRRLKDALDRPHWANTGSLSIQHPEAIQELAGIGYDFQDTWGTMTFSITVKDQRLPSQPGRPDYFDFRINYTDGEGFQQFRNRLQQALSTLNP